MKKLICKKCKEEKNEIEFEYNFFQQEYNKICNKCIKNGEKNEIEYYFKKNDEK